MFSLRCLVDVHDWTTEAVVIRGQSWSDGRERCRRCGTPKPDLSRRTFLMGASAVAMVAAAGPLQILAPVAPQGFLGMEGVTALSAQAISTDELLRRIYIPRIVETIYQPSPLLKLLAQPRAIASAIR